MIWLFELKDTFLFYGFYLGKFKDSEDDAIITLVKTPFSAESVERVLSEGTTLKEEFNNDIYSQHSALTKPENNVITAQIIRPATEKHLMKYSDQKVYLLNETAEDYKTKTLPYLETQKFSLNVSVFLEDSAGWKLCHLFFYFFLF